MSPVSADASATTARVLIEVQAGMIPGILMPEYRQQWAITDAQWAARAAVEDSTAQLIEASCDEYARELRAGGLNWVQTTWIYL